MFIQKQRQRVKDGKYLFNHKALAKVFRAKLLKMMVDNNLQIPKKCPKKWVVDCKCVGNGNKAIIYLGNYLYKGVIQEKDILKCENGMVTFRYVHSKSKEVKLPAKTKPPSKKIFSNSKCRAITGLVQQTVQIVVRCAQSNLIRS